MSRNDGCGLLVERFIETKRKKMDRRNFLKSASAAGALTLSASCTADKKVASKYPISLAQWSLHRMLRSKKLSNLDFPEFTKKTFDIHAVE